MMHAQDLIGFLGIISSVLTLVSQGKLWAGLVQSV